MCIAALPVGRGKTKIHFFISSRIPKDLTVSLGLYKRKERKKNRSCSVYNNPTSLNGETGGGGGRSIQLLSILRIVCEFIGCYELPSFPSYIKMQKAQCWGSLQNNHGTLTPEGVSIYIDNDGVSRETDKQTKKRVILFNFFLIFAIGR